MLAFLARPPVQRDRKMEDPHAHVAVELAALGLAELRLRDDRAGTARAAADGAGNGSTGNVVNAGIKPPLGCDNSPPGSGVLRAHLACGKKRS